MINEHLKLRHIITNGEPLDQPTIDKFAKVGWKFVTSLPAILCDPHAMEGDIITIFAEYDENFKKEYECGWLKTEPDNTEGK